MYIAFEESKPDEFGIVAIHDDKEIVEEFVSYQYDKMNRVLNIRKIPNKYWKKISDRYNDKYLVSYGNTFIPSDDIEYMKYFNDQDLEYQCDVTLGLLSKILEISELSNKKKKNIEKTMEIISDIKDDKEIPSTDDLTYIKNHSGNIQNYY